jgi:hypothetical protein
MNRDIAQYVLQLRDRVTRRQHHVLLVLACHHQMARETYWPPRTNLAAELQMDESQLRRIIGELEVLGILIHTPGIGAGNRSSFIFVEFEKGDIKGDKKGDFSDPLIRNYKIFTKPSQNHLTSSSVPGERRNGGKFITTSSSAVEKPNDDDVEKNSHSAFEINQVIQVYESSPVTTGKAKAADRVTAGQLLKRFSVQQIDYGILLAGSRRLMSELCGNSSCAAQVQSLAYFANAIQEASTNPNMTASYAQYLRHTLRRDVELKARVAEDARLHSKKEPQSVAG